MGSRACMDNWREYVDRDGKTKGLSQKLDDVSKVCFWGLSMADDRLKIPQEQKIAGMKRIAQCFEIVFPSRGSSSNGKRTSKNLPPARIKNDGNIANEEGISNEE